MRLIAALLLLAATPASAEVVSAGPNGFEIKQTVNLVVAPDGAIAAFGELPSWWNPDHTYSGDSANLSIVLRPGGCFCERFPKGGGVEHMRVTLVRPGEEIVLTGSLGPLLYEATSGVMDIHVKGAAAGSQLVLDYKVAGFAGGDGDKFASIVDTVLADQMKRLRNYAAARPRGG